MQYTKKQPSHQRVLKYLFFVTLLCWLLVSSFLWYQYLLSSSEEVVAKWWTFVEGIFDTTSYLPYLRDDWQSKFYQNMLFDSCLTYDTVWTEVEYEDSLCHVTTTDYQTYFVSLMSGHIRSDWVPVSLDDIHFTYDEIIKQNKWNLPWLLTYQDIELKITEDSRLKIYFPNASIDNNLFFTNKILPRHVLFDANIQDYQQIFSMEPVFTKCGKILPQSNDPYSLIFDLSQCEDTYLWFYQIKNTQSFDNLKEIKGGIVDAYMASEQIEWYIKKQLLTNKNIFLFFNTRSNRLRIRTRRSLWGLIANNFFKEDVSNYIYKDEENKLFDSFLSDGEDIKEFLQRITSDDSIVKEDLVDSNIKTLPKEIEIKWTENNQTYMVEDINNLLRVSFKFDTKYDKIGIEYNSGGMYYPQSYNKNTKKADYSIASKFGNLKEGLNKYIIYGFSGKKKTILTTITLYNITKDWEANADSNEKLIVLYYKTPTYEFIVEKLQNIFSEYDVLDHFSFIGLNDANELEGKLLAGDYDIVISSVDMGLKKDFSKLLSTPKPQVNPTQYTSTRFISLLQQYLTAKSNKSSILNQVNWVYSKDMPFIYLGRSFTPIYITPEINDTWPEQMLYENDRRNMIYKNLRLVHNVHVDGKKAWDRSNFYKFLKKNIKEVTETQ